MSIVVPASTPTWGTNRIRSLTNQSFSQQPLGVTDWNNLEEALLRVGTWTSSVEEAVSAVWDHGVDIALFDPHIPWAVREDYNANRAAQPGDLWLTEKAKTDGLDEAIDLFTGNMFPAAHASGHDRSGIPATQDSICDLSQRFTQCCVDRGFHNYLLRYYTGPVETKGDQKWHLDSGYFLESDAVRLLTTTHAVPREPSEDGLPDRLGGTISFPRGVLPAELNDEINRIYAKPSIKTRPHSVLVHEAVAKKVKELGLANQAEEIIPGVAAVIPAGRFVGPVHRALTSEEAILRNIFTILATQKSKK